MLRFRTAGWTRASQTWAGKSSFVLRAANFEFTLRPNRGAKRTTGCKHGSQKEEPCMREASRSHETGKDQDPHKGVSRNNKNRKLKKEAPPVPKNFLPRHPNGCHRSADWALALFFLRSLPSQTVRPTVISFNAALDACGKAGQWTQASPVRGDERGRASSQTLFVNFQGRFGICQDSPGPS